MKTSRSGIEQIELYSQLNHLAGLDLFCHFLVPLSPDLMVLTPEVLTA